VDSVIELIIPGDYHGQGRPRTVTNKFTRKTTTYNPNAKEKKDLQKLIRFLTREKPLTGAISVNLTIYRKMQKSLSKKEREAKAKGIIRPTVKPDIDNKIKLILDAMNGIVWEDDNQIVELNAKEYYSDDPRIEAKIFELDEVMTI
jgi:Holliday junction resolvase RusA-like endonuclease